MVMSAGREIRVRHAISGGSTGYFPNRVGEPATWRDRSGYNVTHEEYEAAIANWKQAGQLAVYLFLYNTETIRYPWRESIRSALALTEGRGAVYVAACRMPGQPDDGTIDQLGREFDKDIWDGRLKTTMLDWGESHEVQTSIANTMLDWIGKEYEWALKLDADEVLHEASFDNFWKDLAIMRSTYKILGKPHYTHLVDWTHDFDFIYRSKAVLTATRSGLRFNDADACAIGGNGIPEYQTRLEIFHYGKFSPGRERAALAKEVSFTKMYGKPFGFPDTRTVERVEQGYIDYAQFFGPNELREWNGQHPAAMHDYLIDAHRRQVEFADDLVAGRIGPAPVEKWWLNA